MIITLNIDNQGYSKKPSGAEIGGISKRTRCQESICKIEAMQLPEIVTQGRTFTPAALNGPSAEHWQSQQLICIDIDNDPDAVKGTPHTPEEVYSTLAVNGIKPMMLYKTFSHTEELPRFRVVVLLDEALTERDKATDYTRRLAALFPGADSKISDPARLIFGSFPGAIIKAQEVTTSATAFEAMPAVSIEAPKTDPEQDKQKGLDHVPDKLDMLQRKFEQDLAAFDLESFVTGTFGSQKRGRYYNPCPICGHNDDFTISGGLWHCFGGSNIGTTGGNILQLLMEKYEMGMEEAAEHFKFNMMGYSREEWKAAYRIRKDAERSNTSERYRQREATEADLSAENKTLDKFINESPESVMGEFFNTIKTNAFKPYKTGFKPIDSLLDGGPLRQSLLLLLAAPAAGKTTLMQQMAEGMAANGRHVLYMCLEMSRDQMLAKALSSKLSQNGTPYTATQIMQGYEWQREDELLISKAIADYQRDIAPFITYQDGKNAPTVEGLPKYLNEVAQAAQAAGHEAPVIILDYLHYVQSSRGLDPAEIVKNTLKALKDYAVANKTLAFVISAVNRDSMKSGTINLYSGRDTSGIEFTGDYVLTLNYHECDLGPRYEQFVDPEDYEEMQALIDEDYRRMSLKAAKVRFGRTGSTRLYFRSAYNYFMPETPRPRTARPFVEPKRKVPKTKQGQKYSTNEAIKRY